MEENKDIKKVFKLRFWILAVILAVAFVIVATLFIVSQTSETDIIKAPTFYILGNFLTFATFVSSTVLNFALIRHGDFINNQNQKNNDAVNARSEAFRTLQFVASNYSAVDFVDHMLIYEVYKRYVTELKKTKNFQFYMREEDVSLEDINADFNNFIFVTVRIPIVPIAGDKSVTSIKFSNFVFHDEERTHSFVPCGEGRNALILYNKDERRQEVVVNLVVKKSSEFWASETINPFLKITFNHTMYSLLGVAVSGWTELYFVNPHKIEKDGANKYLINSSQFEISGLPKLSSAVESDIAGIK